jgi:putative transposase
MFLFSTMNSQSQRYLNNRLEQDHRDIKGRYRPMGGFKCSRLSARFCQSYDELRNFLHPPAHLIIVLIPPITADCALSAPPQRC